MLKGLGIATQRPWSDLAIARTTPILLGLTSLVTLIADGLVNNGTIPVRMAAWDTQALPPFAEAMALARCCLWSGCRFATSCQRDDVVQILCSGWKGITEAVCYAA